MACASGAGPLLALSQLTWEATPFAVCGIATLLLMTWSLLVTSQRILFGRAETSNATPLHEQRDIPSTRSRSVTTFRPTDHSPAEGFEVTSDLSLPEFCVVMPLILLVGWLTLAPHAILKSSEATLSQLLQPHERRADTTE